MKKSLILLVVSAIIFAACGEEKSFDENLQKSYSEMITVVAYSSIMCDKVSATWRRAIYDNKDHNGSYCYDFNDALRTLYRDQHYRTIVDSIEVHNDIMQEIASHLNNPPSSRKDCYNDYIDIVSEASSIARMATDPSGSLQSYNNQTNESFENFSKKLDQFKIKYGEFLKKK